MELLFEFTTPPRRDWLVRGQRRDAIGQSPASPAPGWPVTARKRGVKESVPVVGAGLALGNAGAAFGGLPFPPLR